ncbi:MAG: four helix bundle protein [Desulfuromonadaceae bacterium]|nr:four helix bundle protein [Desulfuromonadaceae bacterium]MDD5106940.1 four helix bundle protein [Desulfuromonadaceae bacterium]
MRGAFVYHKLQVWHLAKDIVIDVYGVTKKFPAEEKFGLVSQITRAAVSVASNIAEGAGRTSRKDQAHFTQLAYGSLMEVACQLEIASDLGFVTDSDLNETYIKVNSLAEKLSALRSSQLKMIARNEIE